MRSIPWSAVPEVPPSQTCAHSGWWRLATLTLDRAAGVPGSRPFRATVHRVQPGCCSSVAPLLSSAWSPPCSSSTWFEVVTPAGAGRVAEGSTDRCALDRSGGRHRGQHRPGVDPGWSMLAEPARVRGRVRPRRRKLQQSPDSHRFATTDNEAELLSLAEQTPAGHLGRTIAAWLERTSGAEELERHQHNRRSCSWRTEPDGMTTFTVRLAPLMAGGLIAQLEQAVMTTTARREESGSWPTLRQQYADVVGALARAGLDRGRGGLVGEFEVFPTTPSPRARSWKNCSSVAPRATVAIEKLTTEVSSGCTGVLILSCRYWIGGSSVSRPGGCGGHDGLASFGSVAGLTVVPP